MTSMTTDDIKELADNVIRMKVRNGKSDEQIIEEVADQFPSEEVDPAFITERISEWREFFKDVNSELRGGEVLEVRPDGSIKAAFYCPRERILVTGFATYITDYQSGYRDAMAKVRKHCPKKGDDKSVK